MQPKDVAKQSLADVEASAAVRPEKPVEPPSKPVSGDFEEFKTDTIDYYFITGLVVAIFATLGIAMLQNYYFIFGCIMYLVLYVVSFVGISLVAAQLAALPRGPITEKRQKYYAKVTLAIILLLWPLLATFIVDPYLAWFGSGALALSVLVSVLIGKTRKTTQDLAAWRAQRTAIIGAVWAALSMATALICTINRSPEVHIAESVIGLISTLILSPISIIINIISIAKNQKYLDGVWIFSLVLIILNLVCVVGMFLQ